MIHIAEKAIPLGDVPTGRCARVHRICGHPDHVHRLEEFGLCDGTHLQVFRSGNPCILRMAGNKICLRADDLLDVLVEPLSPDGSSPDDLSSSESSD